MRRGGQWHRPCEASVNHVAENFDVVLVGLGRQYQTHRQQTLPQHGLYAMDVRLAVEAFERAAALDPRKLFIFLETAAQHFRGSAQTGAYEQRDAAYTPRTGGALDTCYCAPTQWTLDWRNARLHEGLREHARSTRVRLLPYYNLTQPRCIRAEIRARPLRARSARLTGVRIPARAGDMHVAASTQQHYNLTQGPRRAVCDCTHFCYDRDFWSGAFFPALQSVLQSENSATPLL